MYIELVKDYLLKAVAQKKSLMHTMKFECEGFAFGGYESNWIKLKCSDEDFIKLAEFIGCEWWRVDDQLQFKIDDIYIDREKVE